MHQLRMSATQAICMLIQETRNGQQYVHVVGNFLSQLIFIFRLFFGMVMNANEFETKEI